MFTPPAATAPGNLGNPAEISAHSSVASKVCEPSTNNEQSKLLAAARADLQRDDYGAIRHREVLDAKQLPELDELLSTAVRSRQIPPEYTSRSKREFSCLSHQLYDVQLARGRVRAVVLQVRTFSRNLRRGFTNVGRQYFLIVFKRGKTQTSAIDGATCVKRARNATRLGQLVQHYRGQATIACATPQFACEAAFKVLVLDADGTLRSVYDGSKYRTLTWRLEPAKPGHGGGYYYYATEEAALDGMRRNSVFAPDLTVGKELVLCKVEVGGPTIEYQHGKMSASRIRVVEVLRTLKPGQD